MKIPSGEGERRAQRGYVPQYDLGAQVIYEALASGRLLWIGVADRGAASFDDVVVGLQDKIVAYQVKTSLDPNPFSIHTLLLGAESLLGRMVEARRQIASSNPEASIETIYICDDYPRTNDKVPDLDLEVTSASFLRAHEAHRRSWGIREWRSSQFAAFIAAIQRQSGLDDVAFEVMWRNTQFRTGGLGRVAGIDNPTAWDRKRIAEIAGLLPKLVADSADRDRWQVSQLLERLKWTGPFDLRHAHTFPVDALYQSNVPTQDVLSAALEGTASGYISVVGPPGSGKSTLLAAGLLPTPRAHIVRYLAFVPGKGQGLGRGEAFDFLHDLVKQLKQQHLGRTIIPGSELTELRSQLELLLQQASERFHTQATKTIVVVDGLDHVPREEKPQFSFLHELPLPNAVPDGVLFVLGTQRLDLSDIPASVRDQALEKGRCITVAPLTRSAVRRLAEVASVPSDVDQSKIFARTEGHPLSTRYIIDGLLNARTPEDRDEWLTNGPAYGGDIDVFYKRAWHDLESNPRTQRGLAYLGLAEGPINPTGLDILIGPEATDALWRAAGHLLRRNRHKDWTIFHNSFRIFLKNQTSLRHGLPDDQQVRDRYVELAEMARNSPDAVIQRWMELRYFARADKHEHVANLAQPTRFREQFIEGRDLAEIRADISLSFQSAKVLRNPQLVLDLILVSHELTMRTEALCDDVFSTLIYLGKVPAAQAVLAAAKGLLTVGKGFELVEALLANGELQEARELFDSLEPIDKLLGSEQLRMRGDGDGLEGWAEQALAFREPKQVLTALTRLRASDVQIGEKTDLGMLKAQLKLFAAGGQLRRNPGLSLNELSASLEIESRYEAVILYLGSKMSFRVKDYAVAIERLELCGKHLSDLPAGYRRDLANIASALDRTDLCFLYINGVDSPTLELDPFDFSDESLRKASEEVILHASIRSRLGLPLIHGRQSKSKLLSIYQQRLESLGQIHGDALANRPRENDFLCDSDSFIEFLQRGEGERNFDFERGRINRVMDEAISSMVHTAALIGKDTLDVFSKRFDLRLTMKPGQLGASSVRRSYAESMFRHDGDAPLAVRRIAYQPGTERTPANAFSEAALTAKSFALIGLEGEPERVLKEMHDDGLGYARPAKKDPQYLLWEDFLVRANEHDPAGRFARVKFFGRLVAGLSKTEGDGAAERIVGTLLQEAARSDSALSVTMTDLAEECGLSTWSDTIGALAVGIAQEYPSFCLTSAAVIGRLGIPFGNDLSKEGLSEIIRRAPRNQLEAVVQKILDVLEIDAPPERKILAIEDVIETARKRGVNCSEEVLARWRRELPRPKSGSSPEDPFFLLRSLEEISALLAENRGKSSSHGAISAFQKVAPHSDYNRAKQLFQNETELNGNERAIEVMARMAIASGSPDDAEDLVPLLARIAKERGSWGDGWRGKAKQLYYWLLLELKRDGASSGAFDAFVDDLASGRESCDYILPELGPIFALMSPTIAWEDAWNHLEAHLSQFREYKRSCEIELRQDIPAGPEHILADVIFRSVETTSAPLIAMARTAAIEVCQNEVGATILEGIFWRLWERGNHYALEAAQIVWECRFVEALRSSIEALVPSMFESADVAVSRIGVMLANQWNLPVPKKHQILSATYTIELPNSSSASEFVAPSGVSSTSGGLYTEDVWSWTWMLETPLRITSQASGFQIPNLRHRVAQLMGQIGGTNAFGPEAVKRQLTRLRSLSLHTSYRKLQISAAFLGMREVVGELVAAIAIDMAAVPFISISSGAYAPVIRTIPPAIRPVGIRSAELPEAFESRDDRGWVEQVSDDLDTPDVEGFCVLAASAIHERNSGAKKWRTEQYFGPCLAGDSQGLIEHIETLPRVIVADRFETDSQIPSFGAVVHPGTIMAGSIDLHALMLCPNVAAALKWYPDSADAFSFRSIQGDVVAYTLYWRDGGVFSRESDTGIHRYGCAVLVREDMASSFAPYLAKDYEVRAWRHFQSSQTGENLVRSAHRKEATPFPSAHP